MVAITQQAAPDFSAQAANIAHARRLAAALSQAGANYDPTAQISGRTVPLNPLTAVINGLQQGYGAYKSAQADTQERNLESQKHAALIAALSGGQQPDIGSLAKSGLLGADDLVKAVVARTKHPDGGASYDPVNLEGGKYGIFNKRTGEITETTHHNPLYNPSDTLAIAAARNAPKPLNTAMRGDLPKWDAAGNIIPALNQGIQPPQAAPGESSFESGGNIPLTAQGGVISVADGFKEIARLEATGNSADAAAAAELRQRLTNQNAPIYNSQSPQRVAPTQQGSAPMNYDQKLQKDTEAKVQAANAEKQFATDEALRQKQVEIDLSKNKPMPPKVQQMQQDELDAIGNSASTIADMAAIRQQLENGSLHLGLVTNVANQLRNFTGNSTPESVNLDSFQSTLEKLRNDSLRLNKGVQTEGDSDRAWKELISNINDENKVKQRLSEIININERALKIRKANVDTLRQENGKDPMDYSAYDTQPSAVNGGGAGGGGKELIYKDGNGWEIRR